MQLAHKALNWVVMEFERLASEVVKEVNLLPQTEVLRQVAEAGPISLRIEAGEP